MNRKSILAFLAIGCAASLSAMDNNNNNRPDNPASPSAPQSASQNSSSWENSTHPAIDTMRDILKKASPAVPLSPERKHKNSINDAEKALHTVRKAIPFNSPTKKPKNHSVYGKNTDPITAFRYANDLATKVLNNIEKEHNSDHQLKNAAEQLTASMRHLVNVYTATPHAQAQQNDVRKITAYFKKNEPKN